MKTVDHRTTEINHWLEKSDLDFINILSVGRVAVYRISVPIFDHRSGHHVHELRYDYSCTVIWGGSEVSVDPGGSLNWRSGGHCEDATTSEVAQAMAAIWADVADAASKSMVRGHS